MQPLLVRLGLNAKDFNAGFLEARKNLEGIKKNTDELSKSMQNMNKVAKLAFSAWGIYNVREALQSIIRYVGEVSIEMDRMKRSMDAATGSISLGAHAMQFLSKESQKLGLQFRDQIKGFQQLAAAAKGTSLTYKDVREVWLGISEASTVMQLSAEQNKYALYALQQMISKGVVTMEELRRQLGDQIPGAFQIAARAMDVTTQELIKMVSTGNLISEEFVPKFAKQLRKEMAGSVEDASQSIYANINRLKNEFYNLGNDIASSSGGIDAFNESLKDFLEYLKDPDTKRTIENLAETLVALAKSIEYVGKVFVQAIEKSGIGDFLDKMVHIDERIRQTTISRLTDDIENYQKEIDKTREKIKRIESDMAGWRGSLMGKDPFLEMIENEKSRLDELIDRMDAVKKRRDDLIAVSQSRSKGNQVPVDLYGDTTEWDMRVARRQEIIKNFAESTGSSESKAIEKLNKQFQVTKAQLENLKATTEEINELQNLYAQALGKFAEKRKSILDKWDALASDNQEDKRLIQLQKEYDKSKSKLIDLRASVQELAKLDEDYNKAIQKIIEDNRKKRESLLSKWEAKGTALKQDSELAKLKSKYEDTKKQLEKLNASAKDIAKLEDDYNKKITDVLNDDSRSRKDIIDKWKELSADLSDEERAILELERKYIKSRNKLIDLGGYAKTEELAELKRAFESAKFRATDYFKTFKSLIDNIKDITKDTFKDIFSGNIDGWEDMIDRMRDTYLDMLAELATQELFKNIKLSVPGSAAGSQGNVGFGNLFGNKNYNYGASALSGAIIGGTSSQNQNYFSTILGGAASGYAISGSPWGALAGAAGGLIGKWLFGNDKETTYTPPKSSILIQSDRNIAFPGYALTGGYGSYFKKFGSNYPIAAIDRYSSTMDEEAQANFRKFYNDLNEVKNNISDQLQKVMLNIPDSLSKDLESKLNSMYFGGFTGEYEYDWSNLSALMAEKINEQIVGSIGKELENYIQSQESYKLLSGFTQEQILNPYLEYQQGMGVSKPFTDVEDMLNAIEYLKQVKSAWDSITISVKEFTGEAVGYQKGIMNINSSFDQMRDTLINLGVSVEKVNEIESKRLEALNYYNKQLITQRADLLQQWRYMAGEISDYQLQVYDLTRQYEDAKQTLIDLNAADWQLQYLSELYVKAFHKMQTEYSEGLNEASESTKDFTKNIRDLIDEWKISSGVLNEHEAALLQLEKQYESAKQSLIDYGASSDEMAQLKDLYDKSIGNLIDEFTNEAVDSFNEIADSFKNIQSAWSSFFDSVMTDLSPVQSSAYYGQRLSTLYSQATSEEGITNLLDFVQSEYLPFMKAYGESDYNTIWQNIKDLTGNIMFNGQTIGGFDYDKMGSTIGEYVSSAMSNDNTKIIIKIGDTTISEILLSELKQNNSELISEIRRVVGE